MTPVIEQFLSKISVVDSGCWEWTGCLTNTGYGQITYHGKHYSFHRFMYEYYYGQIDSKLNIDHLCRNRICCNPVHLEEVTHKENVLRGMSITAVNAKKTHCPQGHAYDEENTYIQPTGGRQCIICVRKRTREWRARNVQVYC